jgi:toxin-antitoxin system PIN domain toxin
MALLDVNALVALAWDSHVHHATMRAWMSSSGRRGWETCPLTESGFVRVSSNRKVLPSAIGVEAARTVLEALRAAPGHRFLTDDVSICDEDVPAMHGHRQVTDAHLLTLARRRGVALLTFDAAIVALGGGRDVELLTTGEPIETTAVERRLNDSGRAVGA